jgi:hypothetical protein
MAILNKGIKYTLVGGKANEAISKYLEIIVKTILEQIREVKAVVLGGGFARGEGSVEIINGIVTPINDFDIFVITDKEVPEEILNETANQAIKKIKIKRHVGTDFYKFNREIFANTFYIDLKSLTIRGLAKLPPMIRYYELRNAGKVIYGRNYLNLIPDYQIKDLPLAEGFRLLLNRMAMLSLYFSMDFIKRPMTKNEKYGLLYLGSKVYLGSCGALLQLSGKYVPTYLGRLEVLKKTYAKDFPELYKLLPNFPQKVEEAVRYKLKTDFSHSIDPFVFWSEAKKHSWEVLRYLAKHFFNREINTFEEMSDFIYYKFWKYYYSPYLSVFIKNHFGIKTKGIVASFFLQRYMNWVVYRRFLKFRKLNYPRILFNKRALDLTLYSAMIRILYSVNEAGEVDKEMLLGGRKILEKTFPIEFREGDDIDFWNVVNDAFCDAYTNFAFLKII